MDTGGEFPWAADRPEPARDGDCWGGKTAVPDAPDEFANSISVGTEKRRKGSLSLTPRSALLRWCSLEMLISRVRLAGLRAARSQSLWFATAHALVRKV